MLGIRHPLMSAPMAGVSGGRLADAFSQAGGLGLIGVGYNGADWIDSQIDLISPAVPFGVGFITWRLQEQPQLLQAALRRQPRAVFLSFGEIDRFAAQVHDSGACLIAQVQTLAQAHRARDAGADIIVAQGGEAGGHSGQRSTMPFVPAVVDAMKDTPVVAAGGIADGRGIAASLALGACGALIGTALYTSEESLAHPKAKNRAVQAHGDDTVKSEVFDRIRGLTWPADWRLRTLANEFTQRWAQDLPGLEQSIAQEKQRYAEAAQAGDVRTAAVIVGEAIDLVHAAETTAVIVDTLMRQAEQVIKGFQDHLKP
ncbi:MAG: nitronate monooxygenase [Aquabacterium sp.]